MAMFSERLPQIFNALFSDGELRKKLLEKEEPVIEGIAGREAAFLKQYFSKQLLAADASGAIGNIGPLDYWA
jgi:hypothetical protein